MLLAAHPLFINRKDLECIKWACLQDGTNRKRVYTNSIPDSAISDIYVAGWRIWWPSASPTVRRIDAKSPSNSRKNDAGRHTCAKGVVSHAKPFSAEAWMLCRESVSSSRPSNVWG